MTEVKLINWNDLLAKLKAKDNSGSTFFQIPQFNATMSRSGEQVKYEGRILEYDSKTGKWNAFERDGVRWESTSVNATDQKVLKEYKTAIENYARS